MFSYFDNDCCCLLLLFSLLLFLILLLRCVGALYNKLGDLDEADAAAFTRLLELDPTHHHVNSKLKKSESSTIK